ncbi:hypothetical protein J0X19_21955 [Hymenobacter sp. BT186]|uniref:STAS/SEC14 domain-containing protein n=1 Tax=Hymenobacter telluris TaxID=2816474 RepID=A0A939JEP2_9BACT|nr:hypothetical protein [Hymenobacter telluris]MBO0360640.1 hypothetical protein [Hymenobacter telluris]MBW3376667.1 hypothetical protein [Hymenobacter norwichensis]
MPTELHDALGRVYLILDYDAENQWVSSTWVGDQSYASVLTGCNAGLLLLQEKACCCLLNDNRQISGFWSEDAVEWIVANWVPRAVQAGLTHMATVVQPGSLAAVYAEAVQLGAVSNLHNRHFFFLASAQEWLREAQKGATE